MTIGTVLSGRYVVEEVVGTGGMAVVYRAWDRKKRRIVAVKVLRPEFQQDAEFLRRFNREAEAASKVSHENIVNMYDVGADGDTRYIVMEYVDGTTLKEMIRQMGHLSPDAVVRMGIRILAAVDHAHVNGIVHRDIKPQNILVDSQGNVKVADFGIARLKAQQTTRVADVNSSALGSVHYISPEQASGEVADEKSDLYSVGVVLYEMLTGKVPFDGDTAVSVALKHVSEEPRSMREIDPSISKALDEVVLRALRKDPAQRYQTAADMALDLRKALGKPSGGFVKTPKGGKRKKGPMDTVRNEYKAVDARLRRARMRRNLRYAVGGVAIAVVLFLMIMAVWRIVHVRMPDVLGEPLEEAYATLSGGFHVLTRREYNSFVPENCIVAQQPEAGKFVMPDTDVMLTISSGPRDVTISDYTGKTSDEAMQGLVAEGMNDVSIQLVMDESEVGTVVSQQPAAGVVHRDEPMILYVSGEKVLAPQVTGYSLEDAAAALESAGLKVGNVTHAYSADAAAGTIIGQAVAPNSEALAGSAIDLTIAQSQEIMYYPQSDFRVVVPLNNTQVEITLVAPSGAETVAYSGNLNQGTHSIPLSSAESGTHIVRVSMDGSDVEQLEISFQ